MTTCLIVSWLAESLDIEKSTSTLPAFRRTFRLNLVCRNATRPTKTTAMVIGSTTICVSSGRSAMAPRTIPSVAGSSASNARVA